jgi:hypothetical protein
MQRMILGFKGKLKFQESEKYVTVPYVPGLYMSSLRSSLTCHLISLL